VQPKTQRRNITTTFQHFPFKAAVLLLGGAAGLFGQFAATGTSALSVNVNAESAISVTTATTTLAEATGIGVLGAPYTGITNFTYKVRTAQSGGSGSITVKITADFSPAGGPSVGSPLAGDALTYSCTAASSGTACTGPITASLSATNVVSFGAGAHSAQGVSAYDSGSVSWSLPNDAAYPTGGYSATATFTISTT
jgi:hypothetical protein